MVVSSSRRRERRQEEMTLRETRKRGRSEREAGR